MKEIPNKKKYESHKMKEEQDVEYFLTGLPSYPTNINSTIGEIGKTYANKHSRELVAISIPWNPGYSHQIFQGRRRRIASIF